MLINTLQSNLWWRTAADTLDTPSLQESLTADVVIVGGGITGVAAALRLAEQGSQVVLLEANEVGFGGSGRNVGYVNGGLWTEPETVEDMLGVEAGRKLNSALEQGPEKVFSLIKKHQISCEAIRNGNLHCAHSKSGLTNLKERLRQYSERGLDVELLSADETKEKTGISIFSGALWHHGVGTIQPLSYIRGLAKSAIKAGAHIYQNTAVTSIGHQQGYWQIGSGEYTIKADAVLLATNAYQEQLDTVNQAKFTTVGYFQLATKPICNKLLGQILPEKQGCWDTAMVMSSIRRDESGRLIVGAVGSLDHKMSSIHRKWADYKLQRFFPYLDNIEYEYAWHGNIAFTKDHLPKIIEFGPKAMCVFGYSGRGISPGTVFGTAAADYFLTGDYNTLPVKPIDAYSERFTTFKQKYFETGVTLVHGAEKYCRIDPIVW